MTNVTVYSAQQILAELQEIIWGLPSQGMEDDLMWKATSEFQQGLSTVTPGNLGQGRWQFQGLMKEASYNL